MLKRQKKLTAEAEIRQQIKELRKQQDEMEERERRREAERRKSMVRFQNNEQFGLKQLQETDRWLNCPYVLVFCKICHASSFSTQNSKQTV